MISTSGSTARLSRSSPNAKAAAQRAAAEAEQRFGGGLVHGGVAQQRDQRLNGALVSQFPQLPRGAAGHAVFPRQHPDEQVDGLVIAQATQLQDGGIGFLRVAFGLQ